MGYAPYVGKTRDAYRILVGKLEGRVHFCELGIVGK
jgi:hypothetical protein